MIAGAMPRPGPGSELDMGRLLEVVRELVPLLGGIDRRGHEPSPRSGTARIRAAYDMRIRLHDGTEVALSGAADLLAERHVKQLVDRGRVNEARRFLRVLEEQDPHMGVVERWKPAFERPAAAPSGNATGQDPRPDASWLRQNGSTYAGYWVALSNGVLLDCDSDARALARRLSERGSLRPVALFRVPS